MGLRENTNSNKANELERKPSIQPSTYQAPKHYHDGDVELDAIERLKSNILMLDEQSATS